MTQINVRMRRSMNEAVRDRARAIGVSRDEWLRRAVEWALRQPQGTLVVDDADD